MIWLWGLKNWRVLAAAAGLVALLASGWYIHRQIWNAGYNARLTEENAERVRQAQAAREIIVEKGKEYEKTVQELMGAGDSGQPVGDRVVQFLDSLHRRAETRAR